MNSKGHLYLSLAKSTIRLGTAIVALYKNDWTYLAGGIAIAEVLGYLEEFVDKR